MKLRFIRQDRMSIRTVALGNHFAFFWVPINDDFTFLRLVSTQQEPIYRHSSIPASR